MIKKIIKNYGKKVTRAEGRDPNSNNFLNVIGSIKEGIVSDTTGLDSTIFGEFETLLISVVISVFKLFTIPAVRGAFVSPVDEDCVLGGGKLFKESIELEEREIFVSIEVDMGVLVRTVSSPILESIFEEFGEWFAEDKIVFEDSFNSVSNGKLLDGCIFGCVLFSFVTDFSILISFLLFVKETFGSDSVSS